MELCHYKTPEKTRFYEIEAIEIPIVYNKYGDHDPNGLLYVLKKMPTASANAPCTISRKKSPSPAKM